MAEKNLVEETLLQIQNLEDVINENAKEILASTMKEEISELVKESMKQETDEEVEMKEQPEEEEEEESEEEEEMEMGAEDEESDEEMEMDMDDMEDSEEMDMDDMDMSMDDEITDLTDLEDTPENAEMIAQIFKNMKDSDEVTVVQDGDYTKLTDNEADTEYLIQTESTEEELEEGEEEEDEYEYELEEGMDEFDESMQEPDTDLEESEEVMYEIELDEPTEELDEEEYEFELEEGDEEDNESYHPMMEAKKTKKMETKEGMKPKVGKGAKLGSAKKFSYKKSAGGFKENMKKANPTKGTGKPKFEFKEGAKMEKMPKKETKEAARTYGMGWRKGALPKGARTGSSKARQNESVDTELQLLRAKNEEYRKALNMFREKLNEVAVFNSNLAYATRLFTEHSTSKQEKINILRRFDSAETLKESKALYKSIKDELTTTNVKSTPITESIERMIDREPQQSGSAINLIESKTYENPQFLRMKDIMSKIAK